MQHTGENPDELGMTGWIQSHNLKLTLRPFAYQFSQSETDQEPVCLSIQLIRDRSRDRLLILSVTIRIHVTRECKVYVTTNIANSQTTY